MHPPGPVQSRGGDVTTGPASAGGAEPEAPTHEGAEGRRHLSDRRRTPTPMLSGFLVRGRRRAGRRAGETSHVYVDRHGLWMYAAFLALTALSVFDARFTLHELEFGGTEANPVMRAALDLGDSAFVVLKTCATIVGAAFLVLHKTWRLGRACLVLALAAYIGLTVWHLYGVTHVLPSVG